MNFNQPIAKQMRKLKLTQKDLAIMAGVSQGFVSGLMNCDHACVQLNKLKLVADALNVQLWRLIKEAQQLTDKCDD